MQKSEKIYFFLKKLKAEMPCTAEKPASWKNLKLAELKAKLRYLKKLRVEIYC